MVHACSLQLSTKLYLCGSTLYKYNKAVKLITTRCFIKIGLHSSAFVSKLTENVNKTPKNVQMPRSCSLCVDGWWAGAGAL